MPLPNTSEELQKHWGPVMKDFGVPPWIFERWLKTPNKKYHCAFCGHHGTLEDDFSIPMDVPDLGDPKNPTIPKLVQCCPSCREYKGITPCIPNPLMGECDWGCTWGEIEEIPEGGIMSRIPEEAP